MNQSFVSTWSFPGSEEMLLQLLLAAFLGIIIGTEREMAGKTAGMRTYALVSLGSALFSMVSKFAFPELWGQSNFDPTRIAAQIISGIGFIGAGLIIFSPSEERVRGLTTAASIWVTAAIGMAVGFRMYLLAIFTTLLVYLILVVLWWVEQKLVKPLLLKKNGNSNSHPPPSL